ncbi:ATP-dependent zinc metalloprotease FtsH [bacterium]|jgi:cell division protease FtsH|nr:ATP-dependent zinc metalloprotease FtsH [bacterium]MBT3903775.1 ATP-dependent zinc metalloprotease FtsH [bacterium]MBT4577514.1 ATP-dependent zinc metalloprotease FtsH [bacterium]MBT5345440.1 ATP-dependent zinc metalloprotease FtsH [bacterium]MBT6131134.1 ATP-dependent zinc metalloprotease FtsH [bacterium]
MRRPKKFFSGGPRTFVITFVVIVGIVLLAQLVTHMMNTDHVAYSQFSESLTKGKIAQLYQNGQQVEGVYRDGKRFETVVPANWDYRIVERQKDIAYVILPPRQFSLPLILSLLLGFFILGAFLWTMLRQSRSSGSSGGGSGIFGVGRSNAQMFVPEQVKVKFDDVAGLHGAKEDLLDVIDFLKNPKKFSKLGAKVPKGTLMIGEPGNGKTLLAKAVAGEANCAFFSVSASSFVEMFVGVGASRVRDLFARARKNAPCIVFIDEIDAVGSHRGRGYGGGNDEREQTLNQLLTEMDGFATSDDTVVILAATNRPDVLDRALLRPGRFDRQVNVPYPDVRSRLQILQVHIKNIKCDSSVDLDKVARSTVGFSGADLANVVNEAAILAAKAGIKKSNADMFEEALDRITLGKEHKSIVLTELDREMTAYHEAGHTLINILLPDDLEPLHKVTIVPRGRALGVTFSLPERDKYSSNEAEMKALVAKLMAGRIAEELKFDKRATGAHNDFEKATEIVQKMVRFYGMSESLGNVVYKDNDQFSDETVSLIDQEVRRIVKECYDMAAKLLRDNRDKLDKIANGLLESELLSAAQVYALLDMEQPKVATLELESVEADSTSV